VRPTGCAIQPAGKKAFRLDTAGIIDYVSGTVDERRENLHNFKAVEVDVRDGNLEKALRALKNKVAKEGILQELKKRRFYEKPSVRKKRKQREAQKRLRRALKRFF
jgi:small subunit ribosomal protein S21